jgi:type IV secretion system protein VirD4
MNPINQTGAPTQTGGRVAVGLKGDPFLKAELRTGKLLMGWGQEEVPSRPIGFSAGPRKCGAVPAKPVFSLDLESHIAVLGPTGSGKGVGSLMPTLLTYGGSIVMIDVKGEAVAVTARRRKQMGQHVVVIDPFGITAWKEAGAFNPLDIQTYLGGPVEDLAMELPQLMRDDADKSSHASKEGGFWDVKADGLVAGLLAHLLSAPAAETGRTLIALRDLLMADDATYAMAVLMDKAGTTMPALATRQLASFLSTTEVTRSGILATATDRVSAMFHPGIEKALASTSFDLNALRAGKPMTIYLVIPPGKLRSHGRVLRIWISALLSLMQTRTELPVLPTLFLVDEAAQLGVFDQLRTALTLLRGYGVRTVTYWQDMSQLKRLYPDWETLLNNCSVQVMGANTLAAAKAAAELTGASFTPEMILALPSTQAVLIEKGQSQRVEKLNYLTDDLFRGLAAAHPMFAKRVGRRRSRVVKSNERGAGL